MRKFNQDQQRSEPFVCLKIMINSFAERNVFRNREELERHISNLRDRFKTTDPAEEYQLSHMIDQGAFGKVVQAVRRKDNKKCAIKVSL